MMGKRIVIALGGNLPRTAALSWGPLKISHARRK